MPDDTRKPRRGRVPPRLELLAVDLPPDHPAIRYGWKPLPPHPHPLAQFDGIKSVSVEEAPREDWGWGWALAGRGDHGDRVARRLTPSEMVEYLHFKRGMTVETAVEWVRDAYRDGGVPVWFSDGAGPEKEVPKEWRGSTRIVFHLDAIQVNEGVEHPDLKKDERVLNDNDFDHPRDEVNYWNANLKYPALMDRIVVDEYISDDTASNNKNVKKNKGGAKGYPTEIIEEWKVALSVTSRKFGITTPKKLTNSTIRELEIHDQTKPSYGTLFPHAQEFCERIVETNEYDGDFKKIETTIVYLAGCAIYEDLAASALVAKALEIHQIQGMNISKINTDALLVSARMARERREPTFDTISRMKDDR